MADSTEIGAAPRWPAPFAFLIPALVQALALYGLRRASTVHGWPATHPAIWLSLFETALFVPVSMQMLAAHLRDRLAWGLILATTLAVMYWGWFHGYVLPPAPAGPGFGSDELGLTGQLLLLWLIVLPFLQARLQSGRWWPDYRLLFLLSWRNALTLSEAALFAALCRGLLTLWQSLFHLLGIDAFRTLFTSPAFVDLANSLAFGIGLLLISTFQRWVAVVLEQILSVLKWLAVLAALILALFTVTLLAKLPALAFSGQRALGAGWLLSLVAVVVLFLNAAFRDGSQASPYPRLVASALRAITPLLPIVAATAAYALIVRVEEHGLTLERFWGLVVAAFANIYSVGYAVAALRPGPWMRALATVNVLTALFLAAVLALTLTPLLAPQRLAADSQYRQALEWLRAAEPRPGLGLDPFSYLHLDLGLYGRRRLQQLATLPGTAFADTRKLAVDALHRSFGEVEIRPFNPVSHDEVAARLSSLVIYPRGRTLTSALHDAVDADLVKPANYPLVMFAVDPWVGLYIPLHAGQQQFVLIAGRNARVYQQTSGSWQAVGTMTSPFPGGNFSDVQQQLAAGAVSAQMSGWADLHVGAHLYRFAQPP